MKRALAVILAMVLCFQFFGMEARAAEAGISLSSVEGLPGEQISLDIIITGNTGLAYMKLKIAYDSSVLTLISAENTGLLDGTYTTSKTTDVNPYVLQWMAAGNSVGDGVIARLKFKISEKADAGKQTVSLLFEECYDEKFNDIIFTPAGGVVTVIMPKCAHQTKTEVSPKSADCTNPGNNRYYMCASCGLAFKADGVTETTVEKETIPALGHDLTDATCTAPETCTTCGATKGEPLGHTYSDGQDAECNRCGEKREVKPVPNPDEQIKTTPMYRLYNPNTGEHFYTGSAEERDTLVTAGWNYEGIGWHAPINGGDPVYRTYNPNSGDHHYTMSWEEVEKLVAVGWNYEGVAWNSAMPDKVPQFRLYNPNADLGSHHYTSSIEERDFLTSIGWILEGIGWFGFDDAI